MDSLTVCTLQIEGNKRTKAHVISRELLINTNSYYDYSSEKFKSLIRQSEARITNLNLFNSVHITPELDRSTQEQMCIQLTITVVEKWYHWPIPFLEFSDRNFNVWGNLNFDPKRTNYGLYVCNYNLWGKDHTLKTKLKTGYNTKLGVEYRIPFLSPSNNWGMSVLIDHSSQHEVWYETRNDSLQFYKNEKNDLVTQTDARLNVRKRITPFSTLKFTLQYRNDQLDVSVPLNDYLLNNANHQKTFAIYGEIEMDKRNNIFYPTEGSYINVGLAGMAWTNTTDQFNSRLTFKAAKYAKISSKIYTAVAAYSQLNSNKILPYSQRKMFGYDEIIRGYEHYVVDGSSGWKGNASLRYHVLKKEISISYVPENYTILPLNIYAELYADGGYVNYASPHSSNLLVNRFIYSGGIGLNMLFYNDRVIRTEYSLTSLKEHGFFVHFLKAI